MGRAKSRPRSARGDGAVERGLDLRHDLDPLRSPARVLQPQRHLRRPGAGADDPAHRPREQLEVGVPDPGDVAAVGDPVVERDPEVDRAARSLGLQPQRPQHLVGAGRVLDQQDRDRRCRRPRSSRPGRRRPASRPAPRRSAPARPRAAGRRRSRRARCRRCRGRAAELELDLALRGAHRRASSPPSRAARSSSRRRRAAAARRRSWGSGSGRGGRRRRARRRRGGRSGGSAWRRRRAGAPAAPGESSSIPK